MTLCATSEIQSTRILDHYLLNPIINHLCFTMQSLTQFQRLHVVQHLAGFNVSLWRSYQRFCTYRYVLLEDQRAHESQREILLHSKRWFLGNFIHLAAVRPQQSLEHSPATYLCQDPTHVDPNVPFRILKADEARSVRFLDNKGLRAWP